MKDEKYYVVMTDKFLSGWGGAEGKISKFIIVCDTYKQAREMSERCENWEEMRYVNIHEKKPYYSPNKYHVAYMDYAEVTRK